MGKLISHTHFSANYLTETFGFRLEGGKSLRGNMEI